MPAINNVASPELLAAVNKPKPTAADGISATQDRFIKLLVTQMKNQDPLNPLDNAQVTSQLAQLSTVSGIEKLNATMGSLEASYQATQTMQATSLIGHGVLVPGNGMTLADGKAMLGLDLPAAADNVTLTIRDASGRLMQKMDLGPQQAGSLPLTWDGKTDKGADAPDGEYVFEVTATSASADAKIDAVALSYAKVGSVSTGGAAGTRLNLTNGSSASVADVREIL